MTVFIPTVLPTGYVSLNHIVSLSLLQRKSLDPATNRFDVETWHIVANLSNEATVYVGKKEYHDYESAISDMRKLVGDGSY